MKLQSGIELIDEKSGQGPLATKGDGVIYNVRVFLNKGTEVLINEAQMAQGVPETYIRHTDEHTFIDHHTTLGKRHSIAGVERSLIGMQAGGYRKIRVSPHLAYREQGVPGLIPGNAVLVIEIWLRQIMSHA